ncbi:hypothetical protein [Mesorhizobium sp. M1342]|uniref:hypothetical protein n=1 Tax=Mesorhizobium sp. M1342 TaxID=2957088 RepID=UPI003335EF94
MSIGDDELDAAQAATCQKAFLDRPIESDWPYLWIDDTYPMTTHTPLARYSATNGALVSGFATAELHHLMDTTTETLTTVAGDFDCFRSGSEKWRVRALPLTEAKATVGFLPLFVESCETRPFRQWPARRAWSGRY